MDYKAIANEKSLKTTLAGLQGRNIEPIVADNAAQALSEIKKMIPEGALVMNGASRTLEQIGFVEYLKSGDHHYNNLHAAIVAEKDPVKQSDLRKQAVISDYYLGSVHALAETGEFIVASNTGSQLPHIVYTSPNLIFVVGAQKIVPTLSDAMKRLEEHVIPLENENMQAKYGMGTHLSKLLIFKGEPSFLGRKIHMIIVKEVLGF